MQGFQNHVAPDADDDGAVDHGGALAGAGASLLGIKLAADIAHGRWKSGMPAIHLSGGASNDEIGTDVAEQVGDFTAESVAEPIAAAETSEPVAGSSSPKSSNGRRTPGVSQSHSRSVAR